MQYSIFRLSRKRNFAVGMRSTLAPIEGEKSFRETWLVPVWGIEPRVLSHLRTRAYRCNTLK
jgi:hypothetical protein